MQLRNTLLIPSIAILIAAASVAASAAAATEAGPSLTMPAADEATTLPTADTSSPAQAEDGWKFRLGIPVWIPSFDGDVTVKGNSLSPNQEGGVFDGFDSHYNSAFALHFEASKGRFGLFADALYLDLRAERDHNRRDGEGVFKGFVGELGSYYSVIAPESDKRGFGAFRLDALGGVRVTAIELGVNSDIGNASANQTLYDPFVGARADLGLTNWLSIKARGDVGGFGISSWPTSDFSWNVEAGVEFHIAKCFDLGLGYRWLSYDFQTDSGNSKFDATISGPVISLMFNF